MKLDRYEEFSNNRILKEEFIGRVWRSVTGENKERIDDISSICNDISSLYYSIVVNDVHSQVSSVKEIDFDLKDPEFSKLYNQTVEKVLKRYTSIKSEGYEECLNFIENLLSILKQGKDGKEISMRAGTKVSDKMSFIKSLDKVDYEYFRDTLKEIYNNLNSDKNIVISTAVLKNYENIIEQKIKLADEVKNIKDIIESKELYYYYCSVSIGDNVALFVKSLVLKLNKDKEGNPTKICDSRMTQYNSYNIGSIHTYSYDDEYGIDYMEKIGTDILEKKVSELDNYKKLMSEINELKPILDEFYKKVEFLEARISSIDLIKNLPDYISNIDIDWGDGSIIKRTDSEYFKKLTDLRNQLKQKIKEYNLYNPNYSHGPSYPEANILDLKGTYIGHKELFWIYLKDGVITFEPKNKIEALEKFSKDYSSKKVKDILSEKGEKFGEIPILQVEESDSPDTWYKDGKQKCGNILYHGSIHYNLDEPGEIEKLILKRHPYEMGYSGLGVYCTTYPSAACQYTMLRGGRGSVVGRTLPESIRNAFFVPKSNYFPCVYKFTIKPGSKFEFKSDTTMDSDEFYHYKSIGLQGIHSGWNKVSGGETQETCIVDAECIIKIEKLKPSEIFDISNDLWTRGSSQLDKSEFLSWYKGMIDKRKEAQN
jgi:hypothetical protein